MRTSTAIFVLAVACILVGAPLKTSGDPFVRVRGHELVYDREPFHFVGANLAIMHGAANRAAAETVLREAARDGLRVARIWAFGEGDANAAPALRENYLFRAGPEGWVEAGPRHLDRVIAAAGRVGIKLIITLANNWSDYGGVPRYLRWSGQWRDDVYGAADRFYSDARARAAYRAHVERLLHRANQVTGVPYRDDPTILAWELMNESTVSTPAGVKARQAWVTEMAGLIHATDHHHLVTPGVSVYRTERERREWLAVCRLPEVSFCDAHLYPEDLLRNREPALLELTLDDPVQLAHFVAEKPFVLGEFGVHGDADGSWLGQPRGAWLARILERLRFDDVAGGLVWLYQPRGGDDRRHGISVGDPSAEPVRDAMRAAAGKRALPEDAANPDLGPQVGEVPLMPLHAEFAGQAAVVPTARANASSLRLSWDPPSFERASWEATGFYDGGAVAHVWGTETGWYEYQYEVVAPEKAARAQARLPFPVELTVRARVSSEFPGTLSPPDGTSAFDVSLDGQAIASAVAPRDDGRGGWVQVRTTDPAALQAAVSVGPHRLRFTVAPGPHANGLCLYGRPGDKPAGEGRTATVELRVDR
jgi:mannan endo-1,4-beta-mannosidase